MVGFSLSRPLLQGSNKQGVLDILFVIINQESNKGMGWIFNAKHFFAINWVISQNLTSLLGYFVNMFTQKLKQFKLFTLNYDDIRYEIPLF